MFYNPAMALDRDLHVAVTRAWAASHAPFERGWELLAATGVRGLRVLHESGGLHRLESTDAGPAASEVLITNSTRYAAEGAVARRWDAREPLERGAFDWVDVDPFGSPLPYLDAAFGAVRDGGLLSVTATDMIVLAGVQAAATRRRYGAEPVRGRLGPESGLRILLRTLAERARRDGRSIRPLLAYARDHYVRGYVLVERTPETPGRIGSIDPDDWTGPPVAPNGPVGPLWLGPLYDPELVASLTVPPTAARPEELGRLLPMWRAESVVDVPFYYEPNSIAHALGASRPRSVGEFLVRLRASGFRAARSSVRDGAFRTNAPRSRVYALGADDDRPPRVPSG